MKHILKKFGHLLVEGLEQGVHENLHLKSFLY